MAQSVIASLADKLQRRPEWVESNDGRDVLVCGYSLIDTALAFLAGLAVLAAAAAILVTLP